MSTQSTLVTDFTAADRINQLNEIDKDITRLLQSAGSAIKALTGNAISGSQDQPVSIEQQKDHFTNTTAQYFSLLSSIDVRLRRQIYSLEEAGIVPVDTALKESQGSLTVPSTVPGLGGGAAVPTLQGVKEKGSVSGSGLGNLDIGWLNSRNDKVGKEMEAELWGKARKLVEKFANNVSGEMDVKGNDQRTEDDAKSFAHSNNSHETSSKVRSR